MTDLVEGESRALGIGAAPEIGLVFIAASQAVFGGVAF